MSSRMAAAVLFIVAFITVPFPLFGIDGSLVPAARFCQLASVLVALVSQEGTGGMVGLFTGLLVAHAGVYVAVLGFGAWLISRVILGRLSAGGRLGLTALFSLAMVGIASVAPLYDTQFHDTSAHAKLWELYR